MQECWTVTVWTHSKVIREEFRTKKASSMRYKVKYFIKTQKPESCDKTTWIKINKLDLRRSASYTRLEKKNVDPFKSLSSGTSRSTFRALKSSPPSVLYLRFVF